MKYIPRILLLSFLFIFPLIACSPSSSYTDSPPNEQEAAGPTKVVVRILDLESIALTLTPAELPTNTLVNTPSQTDTPVATPSPTLYSPTQTQSPTETILASPITCSNQAKFIKNLNINDNTALQGGVPFTKIWQLENVGTCTWTTSYSLVFSSGETMGGSLSSPLPKEVKPGDKIDLHLRLIAPLYAQSYTGNWMLQDEAGNVFGVGDRFDQPLSVSILVKPPVTPFHG